MMFDIFILNVGSKSIGESNW